MSDEPRKPRAYNTADALPQGEGSFVGKLGFFTGLGDKKRYEDLNHKLVLFHSEEPADNKDERDIVMGYTINNPSSKRLRDLFNNPANNILRSALVFPHILDSTVARLSPEEDSLIDLVTFLTIHDPQKAFLSSTGIRANHFAGFSAYSCDHLSQLHEVAPYINQHSKALMIFNQFALEKIVLERMIERGNLKIRPASPDVIFYPTPTLRAGIAFPDDVPHFML